MLLVGHVTAVTQQRSSQWQKQHLPPTVLNRPGPPTKPVTGQRNTTTKHAHGFCLPSPRSPSCRSLQQHLSQDPLQLCFQKENLIIPQEQILKDDEQILFSPDFCQDRKGFEGNALVKIYSKFNHLVKLLFKKNWVKGQREFVYTYSYHVPKMIWNHLHNHSKVSQKYDGGRDRAVQVGCQRHNLQGMWMESQVCTHVSPFVALGKSSVLSLHHFLTWGGTCHMGLSD
jgi:hypothetical protein